MKRTTRRSVAKMLLAAPAALAAAPIACQSFGSSSSPEERQTPEERQRRQEISKAASRLQASVQRIGQMEIPVGSDPAMIFSPLLPKK